jgi:phage tail-like protein
MNIEVTSADYRAGNSPVNHPIKVNGVYKVGDVTFKRGLIGSLDLYRWVNSIRTGDHTVLRTVHVQLQDEAHNGPVLTWTLVNARPLRYVIPALNAKTGTEVAIEELVLSIEDLSIE